MNSDETSESVSVIPLFVPMERDIIVMKKTAINRKMTPVAMLERTLGVLRFLFFFGMKFLTALPVMNVGGGQA